MRMRGSCWLRWRDGRWTSGWLIASWPRRGATRWRRLRCPGAQRRGTGGRVLGLPLPDGMTPASRTERSFLGRLESLPVKTQRLLLAAAAEPTGDVTLLWRAAKWLGLGADAAAPARDAGLIELGVRVRFRHPLLRLAVYRAAALP